MTNTTERPNPGATKIIIAGSRDFNGYHQLVEFCDPIINDLYALSVDNAEFVSGGARGADKLGERYAKEHGFYKPTTFTPDYKKHYRHIAPLIRNAEMAEYAAGGVLIAFLPSTFAPQRPYEALYQDWQTHGSGTMNMIMHAHANAMSVHVCRYQPE